MTSDERTYTESEVRQVMDAKEFIRDLVRMCKSEGDTCGDCQLRQIVGCPLIVPEESVDANTLVEIVEKWSEEHPFMTNRRKFEEVFGIDNQWIKTNFDGSMPTVTIPYSVITQSWWDAEYKGE